MKEKFTLDQVLNFDLPNIIIYAAPVMAIFVILEYLFSRLQHKHHYDGKDTIAATAVGLGNVFFGALLKFVNFAIIIFFYNLVPWSIPITWWSFVLCLVWADFWRYWSHRVSHENRLFWASHITHHSSQHYNLSVSFRLGWTQYIKIIFFIPVALAGFHPIVFFFIHQIEVLYQFWIHTERIRKLPKPIEFIFTTPSHHRVHHGVNPKYIDKNYGSTFIIWDRMFGTFQKEEEQAIYGITKPVEKPYNPIYLVFHEWVALVKDMINAKSLKKAFLIAMRRPN